MADVKVEPFARDVTPKPEPRFPLVRFEEVTLTTEHEYLVKGVLPRLGLALIYGAPKCGKSFWTFDLVMYVAVGRDYRGRRVHQGPVVYISCEGISGFPKRIEAFRQRFLADHREPVPFWLVPANLNLIADHGELIACIKNALGPIRPAVVVVDTFNRSLVGSESRDEDMAAWIKAADAIRATFDCVVAIVHHTGIDATRPRGHTSLTGAVDAQIAVKRGQIGDTFTATVELMKDGEQGDTLTSRLEVVTVGQDSDGDPITSCVVLETEPEPTPASGPKLTPNQSTMLGILQDAMPHGLTVEEWNEQAREIGIGVRRKSDHSDIRRALKSKRLIHTSGDRWYITTKA